jgi:hypothetical protein
MTEAWQSTEAWRREAWRLLGETLGAWDARTPEGPVLVLARLGARAPRVVARCASAAEAEWLAAVINLALDGLVLLERRAVHE